MAEHGQDKHTGRKKIGERLTCDTEALCHALRFRDEKYCWRISDNVFAFMSVNWLLILGSLYIYKRDNQGRVLRLYKIVCAQISLLMGHFWCCLLRRLFWTRTNSSLVHAFWVKVNKVIAWPEISWNIKPEKFGFQNLAIYSHLSISKSLYNIDNQQLRCQKIVNNIENR